jgi:hypothetical protein
MHLWSSVIPSRSVLVFRVLSYAILTFALLASGFFWVLAESESSVTTDGQSASLSWNKAPIWGLRPDLYYRRTVAGLLIWGALSDERTGLSFTIAAGWVLAFELASIYTC